MARVLIVYASQHGQTRRVAQRIATTLLQRGHAAELIDAEHTPPTLDLRDVEAVLVGSPVIGSQYRPSVVRFARKHREQLQRLPTAFFSVGLAVASRTSDGRAQTFKVVEKLIEKSGWRPGQVELIAGALPYSRYGWLTRFVMRRIAAHEGGDTDVSRDYEYTDWPAVDRFTSAFVDAHLSAPAAANA
jgi:menaquinone-dependent protoporphyrinogen oxidase